MSKLFIRKKKPSSILIIAWVIFAVTAVLILFWLDSLKAGNIARQQESLEKALHRTITYAYATEGHYPESVEVLKEDYGLLYNESLFFVGYQVLGDNIYPDVTVVPLRDRGAVPDDGQG